MLDQHGNVLAREGCDRCFCGCKYWELDRCVDCGTFVGAVLHDGWLSDDEECYK